MYKWKDWNNDVCMNHIHNVMSAIQGLYDSEISFSIVAFWDAGFTAKLGNEMSGFDAERDFDTLEDTLDWLIHKATELYPKSDYAKKFK